MKKNKKARKQGKTSARSNLLFVSCKPYGRVRNRQYSGAA
jgi:hypothetical protein